MLRRYLRPGAGRGSAAGQGTDGKNDNIFRAKRVDFVPDFIVKYFTAESDPADIFARKLGVDFFLDDFPVCQVDIQNLAVSGNHSSPPDTFLLDIAPDKHLN